MYSKQAECVVLGINASSPQPLKMTLTIPCNRACVPWPPAHPREHWCCLGLCWTRAFSVCLLEGSATKLACPCTLSGPPAALEQRALQSPAMPASIGSLCSTATTVRRHGLEADAPFVRARGRW